MTEDSYEIEQLPVSAESIASTSECIKHLPVISRHVNSKEQVQHLLRHIVAIVQCEIKPHLPAEATAMRNVPANQLVLNIAFRAYEQLLQKHKSVLEDCAVALLPQLELSYADQCSFQLMYAMLLTDHRIGMLPTDLKSECLTALERAVDADCSNILVVLKTLNLLCKKFPEMDLDVRLEYIYFCLKSTQCGMREETLMLFTNCCRRENYALDNFYVLMQFWPWTNRNKFYLLSCILSLYKLSVLLENAQMCSHQFHAGVRLSLSYKSLLAASQYLVKVLVAQNSEELLLLSAEILTRGSLREIQNFYAHWFERITQKDKLFEILQQQPEAALFLENTGNCSDNTDHFRLVLIFSMFSRQIFKASKLHFFKISTELITNCFRFELEAQMLIFKFFVDNFGSFAIEDCLEFIVAFVKQHKTVENAQFRNGILGKVPFIINYVAKAFSKIDEIEVATTLGASIVIFFRDLQQMAEADIGSNIYQPQIFGLRLLEILYKSLYATHLEKNAKNCSVAQNRDLGCFLIEANVFDVNKLSVKLMSSLNNPLGFDDTLELVVKLLQQIDYADVTESVRLSIKFSQSCDVDECILSAYYVRVVLQCCRVAGDESKPFELYKFAFDALEQQLPVFAQDPLSICSNRNHLFGYINVIREILLDRPKLLSSDFSSLLDLVETVLNTVLELLHFSKSESAPVAASFQDMDESLELLVQQSTAEAKDHLESRKFLLKSFWLTLKACGDLATTIGCILAPLSNNTPHTVKALERCLKINVFVLTRCRHKGAIEAAGLSIGDLSKCITSQLLPTDAGYLLLENCLDFLFDNTKQVSVTRRGAGYSIMLLHIVKNEEHQSRPILNRVMCNIMKQLVSSGPFTSNTAQAENCDRIEVLLLHYLCVLVKDTALREPMCKYYNEILLATIERIEHPEWMECNAALQLFGALIPKIVGQKQASEFEMPDEWVTTEVTYDEVVRKLPKACEYIVTYCVTKFTMSTATRSIILFLGFLSKVEHLRKSIETKQDSALLQHFRELMWRFLGHTCEKVRELAAICFVRIHEISCELPCALLNIAEVLHTVHNENFFQGLVLSVANGLLKLKYESLQVGERNAHSIITNQLSARFEQNFKLPRRFKPYTLAKLLKLFASIGLDSRTRIVNELLKMSITPHDIGYDVWLQCVQQIND